MLKISFFETRSRFFLFLSRFLRRDRDFCFPYLVFRDEIEIFAFLISFFETRSRFFLSLSRFSRRFETKSRAKSHEIFRDRDISLGSDLYTCIHTSGGQMHRGVNVPCNPLKPCFYIWQVNIFMQSGKIGDTQKPTNKQTQHIIKLVIVQNK